MRGDAQERPRTTTRWGRRRAGHPPLRSPEEIRAQYQAARAFAGEVTRMMPTSHQYTAGQAAALAWLLEEGPAPLTYKALGDDALTGADHRPENPTPEAVARLSARARELMDGAERGDLFPAAYVMGVAYVCEWVQGRTDMLPIPEQDGPQPV